MKCYSAFLDACKAFDTVWHAGLFVKLYKAGLSGDIWQVLYYWYRHIVSFVKWNNEVSVSVSILQGVKQGALLSPIFYATYINDLLFQLELSGHGVNIGPYYCGSPTYADDMCLLASSPSELQSLLDLVYMYATCWRYPIKTKLLVFGESPISRKRLRDTRSCCSTRV